MSDQNFQDPYAAQQSQPQQQWGAQQGQGMAPTDSYAAANTGSATQEHPKAQTVFILGIVGIFVFIVDIIAWYMGGQAKKEIQAGAPYQWGGNLKTGYTLGKVFTIIHIVGYILWFIFYIAMFALAGSSH